MFTLRHKKYSFVLFLIRENIYFGDSIDFIIKKDYSSHVLSDNSHLIIFIDTEVQSRML